MRTYGLIGFPLTHSFSQQYFTQKFFDLGINDAEYFTFSIPAINDLNEIIATHPNLCGFNITIPYKKKVLPFLTQASETVKALGACNCVNVKNGELFGYNTDVIGFEKSLQPFLKPHHQKALILGTGGAAAAVAYVLGKLNIEFQFVSRESSELNLSYEQLNAGIINDHTLIVNTSPVGQYPDINDAPALPYDCMNAQHHLFDLIYNPSETLFLQQGKSKGATIQNGFEMLVLQAEASWDIWNDIN
ncbi:MAG: shikimate dehydrogenase [Sphingobacteriia bacterium]|nr:MAG: shikimate dehydrogenase [Sphingobacteriia bacterium]